MTEFALDLDPVQVLRWLRADLAAGRHRKLDVRATRAYRAEPVERGAEAGLDDDTEAAVLTTIGRLEVRPANVRHVWVLVLRVADAVGPHLPEDESVPEDAEEIDLDAFAEAFVLPDRGAAEVWASADTPEARRAFDRVLAEILTDRHGP
jgi:hypothetical protein